MSFAKTLYLCRLPDANLREDRCSIALSSAAPRGEGPDDEIFWRFGKLRINPHRSRLLKINCSKHACRQPWWRTNRLPWRKHRAKVVCSMGALPFVGTRQTQVWDVHTFIVHASSAANQVIRLLLFRAGDVGVVPQTPLLRPCPILR